MIHDYSKPLVAIPLILRLTYEPSGCKPEPGHKSVLFIIRGHIVTKTDEVEDIVVNHDKHIL